MRSSLVSVLLLLLTHFPAGLAVPARRNLELERRRDRRLAAEAAAAAAAAKTTAQAKYPHLRPLNTPSKLPSLVESSHQKKLLSKPLQASGRGFQDPQRASRTTGMLDRYSRVLPQKESTTTSSVPKRVVVTIGGRPVERKEAGDTSSSSSSSAESTSIEHDYTTLKNTKVPRSIATREKQVASSPSATSDAISTDPTYSIGTRFSMKNRQSSKGRGPTTKHSKTKIQSSSVIPQQSTLISLPKSDFKPDPNLSLYEQRKIYFEEEWKKQGLGIHMHPHALADSIKMMSAAGFDPMTAKKLVNLKLIRAAPSDEYHAHFQDRVRQWNQAAGNAKKLLMAHDSSFTNLSIQEQKARIYQKASQTLERNVMGNFRARVAMGLGTKFNQSMRKKEVSRKKQELIEDIGQAFRKHLAKNNKVFDTMTPEELEAESKGLSHPKANPYTYPRLLLDYIGKHRSDDDVIRYRNARIRSNSARGHRMQAKRRQGS